MAIITKRQADKWIDEGRAVLDGQTYHDGQRWAIVMDCNEGAIHHYPVEFCEQPINPIT